MISKQLVAAFLALGLALAGQRASAAETITNADVVDMAKAGIGPEVIVAKVNTSRHNFDLSTRAILQLKENGVGDDVIKAMLAQAPDAPSAAVSGDRFQSELANASSASPETREAAIAWFAANRNATLPSLQNTLSEVNPANRAAAALVLGRLGAAESISAIRSLLTDASPEPRRSAAQALVILNDQPAFTAAEQALQRRVSPLDGYIRLAGYAKLTRAAGALGQILGSSPEVANRVAAAWALGEIGRAGIAARPAIENALSSDPEPEVRREAAAALSRFNDSASAVSLQNACSLDPAVRKVTLVALADYPEAVPFLVSVMSLGPDQIAADESETARASLVRLTGQDFGFSAQRWNEWYDANRAFFPGPAVAGPEAPIPQFSETAGLAGLPGIAAPAPGSIDMMEAWSIVADSSAIPTAPMPSDSAGAAPFGSFTTAPALIPDVDVPNTSVSIGGAALTPAGSSGLSPMPTHIPDVDAPEPGTAGLRTWSSDPNRAASPPRRAPVDDEVPGWASPFEPVRPVLNPSPSSSHTASRTVAPARPEPPPVAGRAEPDGDFRPAPAYSDDQFVPPPSGISLPIPPVGDLAGGDAWDDSSSAFSPALPTLDQGDMFDDAWSTATDTSYSFPDSDEEGFLPSPSDGWSASPGFGGSTVADGEAAGEWMLPDSYALSDGLGNQAYVDDSPGEWAAGPEMAGEPPSPAFPGEDALLPDFAADPETDELYERDDFEGAATLASESDFAYSDDFFVEPEPGQVVVNENYIQGQMETTPVVMTPSAPTPAPESTRTAIPESAYPDDWVDGKYVMPTVEVEESSSADFDPGDATSPSEQRLAPPPEDEGGFFGGPSSIPVKPEGFVTAPAGKDVPLLGEGMFGK